MSAGLYAIYDRGALADDALDRVEAVLAGGARWLQYRDKRQSAPDRALLAALAERTRRAGAALIVNDDYRVAADIGADGVHLGQTDASVAAARATLGPRAIVGVSCAGDIEHAKRGLADGASYISFGRFFASATKPDAPRTQPSILRQAKRLAAPAGAPVVAIGGIDADNAASLIAAGADMIAVAGALFRAADSRAAARRLSGLFADYAEPPQGSPR